MNRPAAGRVGVVALRVVRQLKRDRRTIGLIVFAPIVLMILFGYALSGDMSGVALGLVDGGGHAALRAHIESIQDFDILYLGSESDAERLISEGALDGAVVLGPDGAVLARAGNRVEADRDASAHAELLAMRAAAAALGDPRLAGCDLFVTLEPCPMCAQAASFFRIRRLVFGAYDPKGGGVEHGAARVEQLGAIAAFGLHIHHVVEGRQRDPHQARGAAGNRHRINNPDGGLDGGNDFGRTDRAAAVLFNALNVAFQFENIFRRVGFRQADHVGPGADYRFQIFQTEGGAQLVDAHDGFDILVHRVLQGMEDQDAGGVFFTQGDGVFQIEHDGIRAVNKRRG